MEEVEDEDTGRGSFVEPTTPARTPAPAVASDASDEDEDESLSYFAKLVNS